MSDDERDDRDDEDAEPGVVRLAELGLVDLEAWRRAWDEPPIERPRRK